MCVTLALGGCATAPLEQAGSLRSYDRMSDANGLVTRSKIRVNKKDVLAAKTIRIASTVFPARADVPLTEKERRLVANAISRELCLRLSERFRIVAADDDADLTVQATVTHAAPTSPTAAGASKALAIAKTVALPGVPVPVPRLPVGLGSLSVEAEAHDFAGFEKAAMVWARGANSIANSPRVANEGDAYDLAADFGTDFAKLVATGEFSVRRRTCAASYGQYSRATRRRAQIRRVRGVRTVSGCDGPCGAGARPAARLDGFRRQGESRQQSCRAAGARGVSRADAHAMTWLRFQRPPS